MALRSGVSVGTLYQYFPNKSALLQACLRRHMDGVRQAIEQTCGQHRAESLLEMGDALIAAYLHAKMRHVTESAALYAVSSDVEGAAIAKTSSESSRRAVAEMFRSAREELTKDPDVIATVVLAALNGVARRVLEERHPERHVEALRAELVVLVHAYLRTCAVPV